MQVKHISSSLDPSILFHSLFNMVGSEYITLEKIKTQEFSLEINTLSDIFNQNTSISDKPSEILQIHAIDPNKTSKPELKSILLLLSKK